MIYLTHTVTSILTLSEKCQHEIMLQVQRVSNKSFQWNFYFISQAPTFCGRISTMTIVLIRPQKCERLRYVVKFHCNGLFDTQCSNQSAYTTTRVL